MTFAGKKKLKEMREISNNVIKLIYVFDFSQTFKLESIKNKQKNYLEKKHNVNLGK